MLPPTSPTADSDSAWQIWIDTGGTFTDCIGIDSGGGVHRAKVLSSGTLRGRVGRVLAPGRFIAENLPRVEPRVLVGMMFRAAGRGDAGAVVGAFEAGSGELALDRPAADLHPGDLFELAAGEEAPVLAARLITGKGPADRLPPMRMRLGTTRATNALLERQGAPVALFITRGLGDLLEIGTQQRPDLFALDIRKPAPLHRMVIEVPGRLDAHGRELEPVDLDAVRAGAHRAREAGITAAAVCLMHSWISPHHEAAVGRILREAGFTHISLSSSLAPLIKILPRAQTTVVNSTLAPVIEGYLSRVAAALGDRGHLHVMTSSGGLVGRRDFAPKDSLLSGPAGGVVGAAAAGLKAGFGKTIAFDMGGTSTDVSRFDGAYAYTFEHIVGDAQIVAPALAIESVAAGGGSICRVEDGGLRVGPQSAGASPGPACYGAGGPLTITDCNLLLGRLDPEGFQIPLRIEPARARLAEVVNHLREQTGRDHDTDEVAQGFLTIAAERMAEAIARISIKQGYDPAAYALVAFGGAGGQHACEVARRLGIRSVVVPADAGLLSALGLGQAAVERFSERQVLARLDEVGAALNTVLEELGESAAAAVRAEGFAPDEVEVRRRLVQTRLVGQDTSLTLEHPPDGSTAELIATFREQYRAVYGQDPPDRPIELESVRVIAASRAPSSGVPAAREPCIAHSHATVRARFSAGWIRAAVVRRAALNAGAEIPGPALILDPHSTTVVEPGWSGRVNASGALILTDEGAPAAILGATASPAAVREELATGRLLAIARDMGEMLQRTALSTNVKERLDFSCAILDAEGGLVVNAPHIPVHLGALGVCVRCVRDVMPLAPGDVVVTNHPACGGSHLPDITVVTPVFAGSAGEPIAFVACRAHHAEIGGTRPGSMPADARTLAEEGVVIPPMYLARAGSPRWHEIEHLLTTGPHPSRSPADNLADLRAQVAANYHGATSLQAFIQASGLGALRDAMTLLTDRAARGADRAITTLAARSPVFEAEERLDDGSLIRVRIDTQPSPPHRLTIDFDGSAPVHPGNLNATAAIIRSAVIYTLRLLIDERLPLNEGLLRAVDLRIPHGMLNPLFHDNPALCPAVAGGNVETSQRVVDTLLKALGLCACSQGTMNSTLFGDSCFGYYETVCGGGGAGPGFGGASAVHTHMTNTRITDPEILERRYPVRLERFAIRPGSGGRGRWPGGNGITRELLFLAPCELSVLTQHRAAGPYGAAGGEPGQPGSQRLIRASGRIQPLASIDGAQVEPGDRLILETPGGGGWGAPNGQ